MGCVSSKDVHETHAKRLSQTEIEIWHMDALQRSTRLGNPRQAKEVKPKANVHESSTPTIPGDVNATGRPLPTPGIDDWSPAPSPKTLASDDRDTTSLKSATESTTVGLPSFLPLSIRPLPQLSAFEPISLATPSMSGELHHSGSPTPPPPQPAVTEAGTSTGSRPADDFSEPPSFVESGASLSLDRLHEQPRNVLCAPPE